MHFPALSPRWRRRGDVIAAAARATATGPLHRRLLACAVAGSVAALMAAGGVGAGLLWDSTRGAPARVPAGSHADPVPRVAPAAWTVPVKIAPGPVTSVSCWRRFCVAVGASGPYGHSHGYAVTYRNGTWSATSALGNGGGYAVSCPAGTFCMAVSDNGYAYAFRDGTWSRATDIYPAANRQTASSDSVRDISCATPGFCVAVTAAGQGLTWNGEHWSGPVTIDPDGLLSISCPTASYCLTGTSFRGNSDVWNGSRWSRTPPGPVTGSWSPSCVSRSFCMVAGGFHASGDISSIWNGTRWSSLASPDGEGVGALGFAAVSCSASSFCAAIDSGAYQNDEPGSARRSGIFVWTGRAWAGPELIDPGISGTAGFEALACTSPGFCVAADSTGRAFVRLP